MLTFKRIFALGSLALIAASSPASYAQLPACQSPSSDSDGDGYGWENNASCLVTTATSSQASNQNNNQSASASGLRSCASASSDPDGDGYGWENNASCLVTASSGAGNSNAAPAAPMALPAASGRVACVSAASDPDGDGFGWENNATCIVSANSAAPDTMTAPAAVPAAPVTDNSNSANTGNSGNRTSSLPIVASRSATVDSSGGDRFATERVGDFLLMQNAWRAEAAAPGHDWSQTIQLNNNGAPVSWTYDWGPGVPGANGRPSADFFVRSYPELIFGIKDEFRTSAPKAEIGFPVRVDSIPTVKIDYAYNSQEFGGSRTVDASVTPRFPNGTTIQGERNVAAESFLYESVNGVCNDDLPVDRSNGSNHTYEVMVWLDSGAERLPAASRNFVTTISLRGANYDVYTKSDDSRYIAFVAQNPQTSGTIYWNDFLNWARLNAHRVSEQFGALANSVQIQDSWCVANILVGTEIFWGAGSFDLFEWTITQSQ